MKRAGDEILQGPEESGGASLFVGPLGRFKEVWDLIKRNSGRSYLEGAGAQRKQRLKPKALSVPLDPQPPCRSTTLTPENCSPCQLNPELMFHGAFRSRVTPSTADQVHGGHGARHRHLLQPQGQDIGREDRVHLLRPPRPHLCPAAKPVLPEELSDRRRLDRPHLVRRQPGVVHHVDQVRGEVEGAGEECRGWRGPRGPSPTQECSEPFCVHP